MAAWLPVVKAALPHIATIVTAALPIFTSKAGDTERNALTAKQIEELQAAATRNAESVRELAAQVKITFESLEDAASIVEQQLKIQKRIAASAMTTSVISLGACIALFLQP
jgi:hypothetical protein